MPKTRSKPMAPCFALLALVAAIPLASAGRALATVSGQWVQLTSVGTPPSRRDGARAVYDAANQRILLYGGQTSTSPDTVFDQVWSLSLGCNPQWSLLSSGSGPKRHDAAVAFDPVHGQVAVFGGVDESGTRQADTWAYTPGAQTPWQQISTGGGPCAREGVTGVWDGGSGQFAVFGGESSPYSFYMNDTWELSMTSPYTWSNKSGSTNCSDDRVNPSNVPDRRAYHVMIYDSYHGKLLVHAGDYEGALGDDIYTSGDDGANWSEILNLSLARMKHTAIYDPTLHRMVVFGGNIDESTEQLVNDAWELSLGTPGTEAWTQLTPAGTAPTVREDHAAAFDPVQDRMIVFGGHTTGGGGMDLNDTWMLSFDTTAPGAISDLNFKSVASTAVTLKWTATGDDGTTGTACHDDVRWSTNPITDDASFAAATQAPNAPAPSAAGAQDTLKISGLPRNVWLYFALKVSDEAGNTSALSNVPCVMLATPYKLCDGGFAMRPVVPEAPAFALDAVHPNPAPGRTTVEFRLPSADPATLELIDLAGRQVWQAEVGDLGGGSHVLEVGGRDHVLAPGFYLVRLRGVRGSVSRSVVITR